MVFFNLPTYEMVNDLNGAHTQRPLPPIKNSQHTLSTITEHPLDKSSVKSDDITSLSTEASGIISTPPFYTKHPQRIPCISRKNIVAI